MAKMDVVLLPPYTSGPKFKTVSTLASELLDQVEHE